MIHYLIDQSVIKTIVVRELAIKSSLPSSPSPLYWKFILGEQIDKYVCKKDH